MRHPPESQRLSAHQPAKPGTFGAKLLATLEKFGQGFIHRSHPDDSQSQKLLQALSIRRRHYNPVKSERLSFARAHRRLRRPSHFARQSDFAEHGGVRVDWLIAETRSDGGYQSEIDCRLVHFQSTREVDEHVVAEQLHAGAFL